MKKKCILTIVDPKTDIVMTIITNRSELPKHLNKHLGGAGNLSFTSKKDSKNQDLQRAGVQIVGNKLFSILTVKE